ncbi:MAG: ParB N-terminal domain-containing protein [Pseudomonadota bacterium]
MAKRKRLSPAILTTTNAAEPAAVPASRPPIAHVAGAAAEQAGLTEVARALSDAREEGRLIQKLPLAKIETEHLVRDRISFDEGEMQSLSASLAARGQQVPLEVVQRSDGRYGLISGLRRVMALRGLGAGEALAIVRQPESASEAYLAMVEENEIRAGISFYERARLAAEAAKLGLYRSPAEAITALFSAASPAKRSKIGSFVCLHEALGSALAFPAAIPERLGLALVAALERDGFAAETCQALALAVPENAQAERAVLEAALRGETGSKPQNRAAEKSNAPIELAPGINLEQRKGRAVLTGSAVTVAFLDDLQAWIAGRAAR